MNPHRPCPGERPPGLRAPRRQGKDLMVTIRCSSQHGARASGSPRSCSATYWLANQSLEFSEPLKSGGNHACLSYCLDVMGPGLAAEPEDGRGSPNTAEAELTPPHTPHLFTMPPAPPVPAEAPPPMRRSLTKEAEPVGEYLGLLQGIGLSECRGPAKQVRGP